MPARVDLKYDQGFFLTEENLVKLDDFVRQRLGATPNFKLEYHVSRQDHAIVLYHKPSEVVAEDNSARDAIKSVQMSAEADSAFVRMEFAKGEGTRVTLATDDRDVALLLSSDIKEYIRLEVLRGGLSRAYSFLDSRFTLLLGMLLSVFGMFFGLWWAFPKSAAIDLKTASASQKLDYLIHSSQDRDVFFPAFALLPIGLISIVFLILYIVKPLFPAYIFYWGKEVSRYDRLRTIRGQLFWVVLVGIMVALIASYIFNWIPHPSSARA